MNTEKPTREEVEDLIKEIADWTETEPDEATYDKTYNAFWERLLDIDRRTGDTLALGSLLEFDIADSAAAYVVTKVKPKVVVVLYAHFQDGYEADDLVREASDGELSVDRTIASRSARSRSRRSVWD
jgi:hypothetical protein